MTTRVREPRQNTRVWVIVGLAFVLLVSLYYTYITRDLTAIILGVAFVVVIWFALWLRRESEKRDARWDQLISKLGDKTKGDAVSTESPQPSPPSPRYCSHCGFENATGWSYCSNCGKAARNHGNEPPP